ncbi:hypothetical protein [Peribacillus sp. NPDC058002]|uniref:hypothetical protein n=1 Tax=Peribacillus sp. NPDC058002 TaxID=3346301 RepID=UPI0036D94AC6
MTEENYNVYNTSIVYDYKDHPNIKSGRCDNCGNAQFKISVKGFIYIRECRNCGMNKSI